MANAKVATALVDAEDNEYERPSGAVSKVDRVPLEMAKVQVGAAVTVGIGPLSLKQFGDAGLLSKVCSGEKAPEYLARIYANPDTRRRFALAWLAADIEQMHFTLKGAA